MTYLVKIGIYVVLSLLPFFCVSLNDRNNVLLCSTVPYKQKKIRLTSIFICSILFGWYSTICSKLPYVSDRRNYVRRFVEYWDDPWTFGLNTIADILHLFTNNPNVLFFTITFLCVFLTLMAYRISKDGDREILLLWTFGMSVINTFYLLKQAPAIALGTISIVFFLKRKYFSSVVFLLLAVLFHESTLILLPLYVAMFLSKKQWRRWAIYLVVLICVVLFVPVSRLAIRAFSLIYPDLISQLSGYLDETGAITSSLNFATALKGLPYYLITLYGFINRKGLKNEIQNYDQYLMMSVCASGLYMLSVYMYWMWRFAAYCFFPMYLFASELYRKKKNRYSAQVFLWSIFASLAFFSMRYLYQIYFNYGGF